MRNASLPLPPDPCLHRPDHAPPGPWIAHRIGGNLDGGAKSSQPPSTLATSSASKLRGSDNSPRPPSHPHGNIADGRGRAQSCPRGETAAILPEEMRPKGCRCKPHPQAIAPNRALSHRHPHPCAMSPGRCRKLSHPHPHPCSRISQRRPRGILAVVDAPDASPSPTSAERGGRGRRPE